MVKFINSNTSNCKYNSIDNEKYSVTWKGYVYTANNQNGNDSINTFLNKIDTCGLNKAIKILRGHFLIIIENKKTSNKYIFIDNAGFYKIFYTNKLISDSFLELIKENKTNFDNEMSPLGLIEFLSFGKTHNGRTFLKNINLLGYNEVLVIKNDQIKIEYKNLHFDHKQSIDIYTHFNQMKKSLQNKHVNLDITGGADTRLIIAMMEYLDIDYDISISGPDNHPDVKTARVIAQYLKKDLIISRHNINNIENEISDVFNFTDGYGNFIDYHRGLIHEAKRKKTYTDIVLSGNGGVLYKDTWWVGDFPFYNRRKPNLNIFYRMSFGKRLINSKLLSSNGKRIKTLLSKLIINELQDMIMPSNTKTYDNIYYRYHFAQRAGKMTTAVINKFHYHYNPLLETDIVNHAYFLSRYVRLFNIYHRKIISNIDNDLAKITANEHFSLNFSRSAIIKDIISYAFHESLYFSKRIIGNPDPSIKKFDYRIYDYIRNQSDFKEAINYLIKLNILKVNIPFSNIPNGIVGNIFTLGLLLKHIDY